MQIRKHEDYRVNIIADLIERMMDYNYYIKPFDMAVEIVKSMDYMQGVEYAKKLKHYQENENYFLGKDKV